MYQPFNIGRRFRITPPDNQTTSDNRIDIVMQRGAFGSGEHETTESCLELMEGLTNIRDARVLDLGSGTGILAIAALKLGAAHAVCVDIEANAVETARTNCQLNGLENQVTHITGTLEMVAGGNFDLILANIYGDILLLLAKPLAAKGGRGSTLLLSGILWEYNFDVRQAYERQGCIVAQNLMLEEFSTVLLTKSG
jgi:ribosomal protein L11 methyltransferase